MPMWWPAVVFGWPGPILATVLSAIGIVRRRAAWLVAAALALIPFSFYLFLTPRFWWGVFLPVLPLVAARAVSRGANGLAWAPVLVLVALLLGFAWLVIVGQQPRPSSV